MINLVYVWMLIAMAAVLFSIWLMLRIHWLEQEVSRQERLRIIASLPPSIDQHFHQRHL